MKAQNSLIHIQTTLRKESIFALKGVNCRQIGLETTVQLFSPIYKNNISHLTHNIRLCQSWRSLSKRIVLCKEKEKEIALEMTKSENGLELFNCHYNSSFFHPAKTGMVCKLSIIKKLSLFDYCIYSYYLGKLIF